jgi:hypothetical protein
LGPPVFQHFWQSRQGVRRPRARRCLLKDCEQWFFPSHPQARYCSVACRKAAQRWRRWRASQKYRASSQGQERRREQQRRYRQRCRQRQTSGPDAAADKVPSAGTGGDEVPEREGQRPASAEENFGTRACDRPGCYERFVVHHACSNQRFCSSLCRLALRRVLDREARYRQRRRRRPRRRVTGRCRDPDTS